MAAQRRSASLAGGTVIGRYRIGEFIGAGGMGEVYAATDLSLDRRVALKLLPGDSHADPARRERFLREARAASALNHPAVVSVYDAGVADGQLFIAMELLDGEPLSVWMRGRHDTPRALEIMAQVADGLARAHAAGIVHRDLKPDNVMVARGGFAKIVDFGIAKLIEPADSSERRPGDTAPEARLGTAAYMSPEQVAGRAVDHRSDIFSFGALLYEVLTRKQAFGGATHVDSMHAILHAQPSMAGLDLELQRIIRRCLAKDPEDRYQSIRDVALDLRDSMRSEPRPSPPAAKRRTLWTLIAALLIPLGAFVWFVLDKAATPGVGIIGAAPQRIMVRITNHGSVTTAAMSPDGRLVVYSAAEGELESLWVKQIATGTTVRLTPPFAGNYVNVRVSPDGTYVYYTATTREEHNVANLFEVPILGGQPRRVANDTEYGFTLSPDGTRVAFRRYNAIDREHRLTIASIQGGEDRVVLRRQFPDFIHSIAWSPDGKRIAFVGPLRRSSARGAIFELSLETGRVEEIRSTQVGLYAVEYMPDGSGFLAAAYDREQPPQVWYISRRGDLRKITSDISSYSSIRVAADGKSLIAVRDEPDSNVWVADAADGRNLRALTSGVGNLLGSGGVSWLGNEKVIYTSPVKGQSELMAVDVATGASVQLLRRMEGWDPAGSPDGKHIAYVSDDGGTTEVWVADATGNNARPVSDEGRAGQPSFADGGRRLVYTNFGADQYTWSVDLQSGAKKRLTDAPANRSTLSPDGKWLLARLRSPEPAVPLWRTVVLPASGPGEGRSFDVPRYAGRPELRWLPDGKSFSFIDWKDGVANVWIQDLSGGEPRQITFFDSGKVYAHAWSPDGKRVALSRGTPMSDVVMIRDFR